MYKEQPNESFHSSLRSTELRKGSHGVTVPSPANSIEKHVHARNTWTARPDTFENLERLCAMLLPEFRIAPGIVHHDNSARFDPRFRLTKTDRPDLGPFPTAVNNDNVNGPSGIGFRKADSSKPTGF
jgi:hypothetical protein